MATVASLNTANPGNGSSITVTKPTGLSVGDLMIFHYAFLDATDTADTISGWTHEVNNYGTTLKTGLQYKIADSSDVAASNFTMSFTGAVVNPIAGLLRITDFITAGLLNENKDTGPNTDTTLAMTVTPQYTNNLLLFFLANNEGCSISTYSIANDNPTWEEKYDIATADVALACASATRTQTTATGDASFTYTGGLGGEDFFGIMVAIETPASITVSIETPGTLTLSQGGSHDFILGNIFPIETPGTLTLSGEDITIDAQTNNVWTEETKNQATWTEETK